jgi:hypothetical protein
MLLPKRKCPKGCYRNGAEKDQDAADEADQPRQAGEDFEASGEQEQRKDCHTDQAA